MRVVKDYGDFTLTEENIYTENEKYLNVTYLVLDKGSQLTEIIEYKMNKDIDDFEETKSLLFERKSGKHINYEDLDTAKTFLLKLWNQSNTVQFVLED